MSDEKNKAVEHGEFKKEVTVFGGVSIVAGIMTVSYTHLWQVALNTHRTRWLVIGRTTTMVKMGKN